MKLERDSHVDVQDAGTFPDAMGFLVSFAAADLLASPEWDVRRSKDERSRHLQLQAPGFLAVIDEESVTWSLRGNSLTVCKGAPRWAGASKRLSAEEIDDELNRTGAEAYRRLRGRYSVVRLDMWSRALTLVTDRFAVHPICYAVSDRQLIASDRADCIAKHVNAPISLQAIYDYLYFHVIPSPGTVFRGVHRVEPATCLTVTESDEVQQRLWSPVFSERTERSVRSLKDEFLDLLDSTIQRELNVARVGTFLSGGTDSSTIAGVSTRLSKEPIDTYSIGFEHEGYDEMAYARIAARQFGTRHNEYY